MSLISAICLILFSSANAETDVSLLTQLSLSRNVWNVPSKGLQNLQESKHTKWQIFWILDKESTFQCLSKGLESKSQSIRADRTKHFRIQCRMNCSTYLISEVNNLIISLIILWVKNWLKLSIHGLTNNQSDCDYWEF